MSSRECARDPRPASAAADNHKKRKPDRARENQDRPSKTHKRDHQGAPLPLGDHASVSAAAAQPGPSAMSSDASKRVMPVFHTFASNLAALLSYSPDELQCLDGDKRTLISTVRAMSEANELPWLALYPPPPPLPALQNWPPPLPPIKNRDLIRQVFTHKSFIMNEWSVSKVENLHYERLEWLGDAYLQMISTQLIYERFPGLREGRLTNIRVGLVCNHNLTMLAKAYHFERQVDEMQHLHREGHFTMSPDDYHKVLADCFESYIGAIVLDAPSIDVGLATVRAWLTALYEPKLREFEARNAEVKPIDKMAKQELQKFLGGNQVKLDYRWKEEGGGEKGGYCFEAYLNGWGMKDRLLGQGVGATKQEGQARAAMDALDNESLMEEIKAAKEKILGPKPPKGEKPQKKPEKKSDSGEKNDFLNRIMAAGTKP